ncbi:hypothetical protein KSC_056770 [Ktedonobacter sp. SOSP1-52]|nr:hypothetical protein KSC_056770 [Ktedonobacter sp. SOSP1-52]
MLVISLDPAKLPKLHVSTVLSKLEVINRTQAVARSPYPSFVCVSDAV